MVVLSLPLPRTTHRSTGNRDGREMARAQIVADAALAHHSNRYFMVALYLCVKHGLYTS